MNYKLEKFWNCTYQIHSIVQKKWTINLKSFEMLNNCICSLLKMFMNYKLEKFWNNIVLDLFSFFTIMNYKLEKFWNNFNAINSLIVTPWTINLKSFEIHLYHFLSLPYLMNYKLEKFWNLEFKKLSETTINEL